MAEINPKAHLLVCGSKINGIICDESQVQMWSDGYIQCVSCARTFRMVRQ